MEWIYFVQLRVKTFFAIAISSGFERRSAVGAEAATAIIFRIETFGSILCILHSYYLRV